MIGRAELVNRAREYGQGRAMLLGERLGFGVHGIVFAAEIQGVSGRCAVKAHERATDYSRERDVYLRLREHDIKTIRGCDIPELLHFDDVRWVLEMTVVTPPFILDFAGAALDQAPDFSEEVLADWQAEKRKQFGSRWPEVQAILRHLQGYGVFLIDVTPNNIVLDR